MRRFMEINGNKSLRGIDIGERMEVAVGIKSAISNETVDIMKL